MTNLHSPRTRDDLRLCSAPATASGSLRTRDDVALAPQLSRPCAPPTVTTTSCSHCSRTDIPPQHILGKSVEFHQLAHAFQTLSPALPLLAPSRHLAISPRADPLPRPTLAAFHRLALAHLAVGADGSSPASHPLECCKGSHTFYCNFPVHFTLSISNPKPLLQALLAGEGDPASAGDQEITITKVGYLSCSSKLLDSRLMNPDRD
jgi:hypothetical protein